MMPLTYSPFVSNVPANEGDGSAGLLLLAPAGDEAPRLAPQISDHVLTPQISDHVLTPQYSRYAVATGGARIEAIQQCRIPPFWKTSPELWFFQVETIFQTHQVRSDDGKYHLVVGALDAEALQEHPQESTQPR